MLSTLGRLRLKCDGTRGETRFRLSAKRMSPFKSAGASVQSTAGSRGVRISDSNAGYTMFRGSVKSTGYPPPFRLFPLHFPSRVSPCVTVCHHISAGLYKCCYSCTKQNQAWPIPRSLKPSFVPSWQYFGSFSTNLNFCNVCLNGNEIIKTF